MAPKKGQKMSISAFLNDASTGSWADEMESLPTAPEPRESSRSGTGSFMDRPSLADRRDGSSARQGVDLPLPTKPPYTAHLGNLSYDLTDSDVRTFFDGCQVTSVRILKDIDERPKGFGYVEFDTLDGLKKALERSGNSLTGRPVRVSVAEPSRPSRDRESGDRYDRDPVDDRADQASTWRRSAPLEPPPPVRSERRSGFGSERRDFDGPGADRYGSGGERGGFDRDRSGFGDRSSGERGGFGRERSFAADLSGEIEQERGERMGFGSKFVPSADTAGARSSSFRARESGTRAYSGAGAGALPPVRDEESSDWRRVDRKVAFPDPSAPSSETSTPAAPSVRKPLELKKRTTVSAETDQNTASSSAEAQTSTSKPSPFGNAKPIDNNAAIKRAEDRAAARLEEEKAAREAAREAAKQAQIKALADQAASQKSTEGETTVSEDAKEVTDLVSSEARIEARPAATPSSASDKPRITHKESAGPENSTWTKRTLAPSPAEKDAGRRPAQRSPRANGVAVHPSRRPSAQAPTPEAATAKRPSQAKTAEVKRQESAPKQQAMPRFEGLNLDEEA